MGWFRENRGLQDFLCPAEMDAGLSEWRSSMEEVKTYFWKFSIFFPFNGSSIPKLESLVVLLPRGPATWDKNSEEIVSPELCPRAQSMLVASPQGPPEPEGLLDVIWSCGSQFCHTWEWHQELGRDTMIDSRTTKLEWAQRKASRTCNFSKASMPTSSEPLDTTFPLSVTMNLAIVGT